jgi:hypothetical protein
MHCPERWGFVQFTKRPANEAKFTPDPTWTARELLMEIYHRQKAFHDREKRYAKTLPELGLNPEAASQLLNKPIDVKLTSEGYVAVATIKHTDGPMKLCVRQDSRLWREP